MLTRAPSQIHMGPHNLRYFIAQIWSDPPFSDRVGTVQTDSSAHSTATLAALGVAPLVSQTLGLVDGRAPDVMPAIRARSADGWPTLRGDEARIFGRCAHSVLDPSAPR